MFIEPLDIVVTGDIDSGKSTLIGRFLYEMGLVSKETIENVENTCRRLESDFEFAYLLDSFQEERTNQLTIDTTQVYCKSKNSRGFIFIDVPGHRELLKNMLCGSSYADIAILVVDVQKSIEEQTKRHAFILKFLGIKQIIVVLNKMDLVGFKKGIFQKVKEETTEFFKKIQFQPAYFIPTSARQGDNLLKRSNNMPWYKGLALTEALNSCFNRENLNSYFRFPIQDIYNLNGKKIAVGEVVSGKIKIGEKVNILPLNKVSTVKEIKVFNQNKQLTSVPESVGLILDGMDELRRGQIVCKPRLPEIKTEILAKIFCVQPLDIEGDFKFRCLTQESNSRITEIIEVFDTANLEPKAKNSILAKNDSAQIILHTETPVVIESFERLNALSRFVLQDNHEIVAVGIVS